MASLLTSLVALLLALPPLTEAQREQLSGAVDRGAYVDEPALYPLLDNATTWEPGDEAGARVPDYDALYESPAAMRGEAFLIEGEFARARRMPLVRPGPWGDALTEWTIRVARDPDEVAVVYFVDPQDALPEPRQGAPVRAVGRFFKLWGDEDFRGEPATYLTFVGRSALVVAAARRNDGGAAGTGVAVALALVAALLVALVFLKRIGGPRKGRADRRPMRGLDRQPLPVDGEQPEMAEPALPEDPAAALEELQRRGAS